MKKKINVLRIIPTIDPIFGGPSKTIVDSSIYLKENGFNVDILTGDQAGSTKTNYLKNTRLLRSNKIKIINQGRHSFGNYCFNINQYKWLKNNKHKYDFIIVHGLWQFSTLMARILLKKNFFVFIHGQLDPWFKEDFIKKIKKKLYWFFIERKNLLYSKSILITSKGEKTSLNQTYVNTNGIRKKIIQYGILKPKINKKKVLYKFYKKFPQLKNKGFYLFLGRFHEKKGCDTLIKSVRLIKKNFNDKILFAGPLGYTKYERNIIKLTSDYDLKNNIIFSDILLDDLKWGAILASKAMVLASHGENFGVSLVESMSLSRPILTTNKVNIFNEIKNYKAGYVCDDNVKSFANILLKFSKLERKKLRVLSKNAYNCFAKNFDLSIDKKNSLKNIIKENICVE